MIITIETTGSDELEQLLKVFKALNIKNFNVEMSPNEKSPVISKGDKTIDPKALFGIWERKPRTIETIRSAAWKRNRNN